MPFNPLLDSFDDLTDTQIDEKVQQLSRKYWQTRNPDLQLQIASILEMYQEEARSRRAIAARRSQEENGRNDLDNLINIS